MPFVSTGAVGAGMTSDVSVVLVFVFIVIFVAAYTPAREGVLRWFNQGHSARDINAAASDTAQAADAAAATPESDSSPLTGRASDRDSYDFDLDVLSEGDTC